MRSISWKRIPAGGVLSDRMTGEGNIWRDTWTNAKAIPVALQKRLFNESREAEKVAIALHLPVVHLYTCRFCIGSRI
jgi:Rab3 GTPase-activating protein catalytic subunit